MPWQNDINKDDKNNKNDLLLANIQKTFAVQQLSLAGAYIIKPKTYLDERGFFIKLFEERVLERLNFSIKEFFYSSNKKHVLRGLHYLYPKPQSRLVCCLKGKIYDVIVDLRKTSSTYGKWTSVYLSGDSAAAIFIPKGFAHGFLSLRENTIVIYFTDGGYKKDYDFGIRWDDPDLKIKWPIKKPPIISNRDSKFPFFKKAKHFVHWPVNI
ncbi:MAG: dTDP-4-dehydrorhamnose 3,5-epimerase [Candidatus Aenigmarchaeota archaeon]|nr:dTDP-4-dehydrorhamnose 3,5-epimerase [Candidatus Aenigmarchaeota archaeon]